MSDLGNILAGGMTVLRTAIGQVVEYRNGKVGSWTVITDAVHHIDDNNLGYDESSVSESVEQVGHLLVPEAGPILGRGFQIRLDASDLQIFAIMDGPEGAGVRGYGTARTKIKTHKQNRDRTR